MAIGRISVFDQVTRRTVFGRGKSLSVVVKDNGRSKRARDLFDDNFRFEKSFAIPVTVFTPKGRELALGDLAGLCPSAIDAWAQRVDEPVNVGIEELTWYNQANLAFLAELRINDHVDPFDQPQIWGKQFKTPIE